MSRDPSIRVSWIPIRDKVGIGIFLWLVVAILLGLTGITGMLKPPALQILILILSGCVIYGGIRCKPLRTWLTTVDPRCILWLHISRFVGIYFLVCYQKGILPFEFAVPGGCGDIGVATFALILILTGPIRSKGRLVVCLIWNTLGLIDILFVVATAARMALTVPGSMDALLRLPLSLLPTWLVPLVISSHILLGLRLWKDLLSLNRSSIISR